MKHNSSDNDNNKVAQLITFNSRIPDDQLRELLAPAEIVEIRRGAWQSFVDLISSEDKEVLDRRIKIWFENSERQRTERHERESLAIYQASADRMWKDVAGIPALLTRTGQPTLKGYFLIDDDGKTQYVFPGE